MTNPQPIDFTGIAGTFYLFFLQKSGYNIICPENQPVKHNFLRVKANFS